MGDADYLYAFQQVVIPVAYDFDPDLVISESSGYNEIGTTEMLVQLRRDLMLQLAINSVDASSLRLVMPTWLTCSVRWPAASLLCVLK